MSQSFHKIHDHLPFTQPRIFSSSWSTLPTIPLLSSIWKECHLEPICIRTWPRITNVPSPPPIDGDIIFREGYRETSIGAKVLLYAPIYIYIYIQGPINGHRARRYAPPPPPPSKNGMRQFSCNDRLNPLGCARWYQSPLSPSMNRVPKKGKTIKS